MNELPYTQATNFISAVQGVVDPRTGLFTVNMVLAELTGNDNLGPDFLFTLNYSPLSTSNICGFGIGCSVGISIYDKNNKLLLLSSGERYKIEDWNDGVYVRQKKINNFKFEKIKNGYIIKYKNGKTEYLYKYGDNLFLPQKIFSTLGWPLKLTWENRGQYVNLKKIEDAKDVLCKIDYQFSDWARITFWPGKTESYTFQLDFVNEYLYWVTNKSTSRELAWSFNYDDVGAGNFTLTQVKSPTGLTETVNYQAGVMRFPDESGKPALPSVYNYRQSPGMGQPDIVKEYEYTASNYLGYGASLGKAWNEDEDNIYNVVMDDYTYSSTEKLIVDNRELVSISRIYNSYYLLISETTRQNSCEVIVETDYYAKPGLSFDKQPKQFQLPKEEKKTWRENSKNQCRSEITTTTFDPEGNLLTKIEPDGTKTEYIYYDSKGETDKGIVLCPPEPNGFVRFVKTQIVTPADSEFYAPVQQTTYAYAQYPCIAGSSLSYAVLQTQETLCSDDVLLLTINTDYIILMILPSLSTEE
ncbi:hypothetical protein [Coxiella burnetii]|uniref:Uncharacterized protein n=1 Tax=Coxiella burnetii TaxID=777 RepID=O52883_COXBE|nr:hypothetical protein [Coxiella burnetii]CAA75844.1 hypothetical protein [Coxiella burnetii]